MINVSTDIQSANIKCPAPTSRDLFTGFRKSNSFHSSLQGGAQALWLCSAQWARAPRGLLPWSPVVNTTCDNLRSLSCFIRPIQ